MPAPLRVLAILQARMSSSRLPGKVMLPLLGEAMLARQLERVGRAKHIDKLLVATSSDPSDDAVEALCKRLGVGCFRGSLDDVLDRFVQAASAHQPAHVLRLTADCPLADPVEIDRVIAHHLATQADYTSNANPPTFPDGLDAEVLRYEVLLAAHSEAVLPSEREHVTLFVVNRPQRFHLETVRSAVDLSHLRWTVNKPDDLELLEQIYAALYPQNPAFGSAEVLQLLEARPELRTWNTRHKRNEGLALSLAKERKHV